MSNLNITSAVIDDPHDHFDSPANCRGAILALAAPAPATPLGVDHCLLDLGELIQSLYDRRARNIEAVRALGRDLTPAEDARFEVGFGLATDMIRDLEAMQRAWSDGCGAYRVTERALGREG